MKRKEISTESEWLHEASTTLLSGSLSSRCLHRLVSKAQHAGARGAEILEKAGMHGSCEKNISRDMHRSLRRLSDWPNFYYAEIPLWDPKSEKVEMRSHPFLLPHEWLAKANALGDLSTYHGNTASHASIYAHIDKVAAGLNTPSDYIPLGLHFDGVPFGSQVFYSDSLELFSLNFPCSTDGIRVPFTSVQKTHLVKHVTYNAILEILSWSLKHLAFGTLPVQRHDGTPWGIGEHSRSSLHKSFEPAKALLMEIRADWVALKQVFQFPQQNENAGICWMCFAKPADIRDCNATAAWRHERRTSVSFHAELARTEKSCPLWSVPGVCSELVVVDWLHCADLGVAADVIGNVLFELLEVQTGHDRTQKMSTIWSELRAEYKTQQVSNDMMFPTLRLNSFFKTGKSPKLKGKAAHIRGLVPVVNSVAQRLLVSQDIHTQTVKSCMQLLAKCYDALTNFSAADFEHNATRMAILYCALEKEQLDLGVLKRWKVKPKLHLFLELAYHLCLKQQKGNPRQFWTYADEGHGGQMKDVSKSRGGPNKSASSSYRMLCRFVTKRSLPGSLS